jgi:hypothetical protein
LNWKETYVAQEVQCGQGNELYTPVQRMGLPWEQVLPFVERELCDDFFERLDTNACVPIDLEGVDAKSANSRTSAVELVPAADDARAWCYVSAGCEDLGGGDRILDSATLSWKVCRAEIDTFLEPELLVHARIAATSDSTSWTLDNDIPAAPNALFPSAKKKPLLAPKALRPVASIAADEPVSATISIPAREHKAAPVASIWQQLRNEYVALATTSSRAFVAGFDHIIKLLTPHRAKAPLAEASAAPASSSLRTDDDMVGSSKTRRSLSSPWREKRKEAEKSDANVKDLENRKVHDAIPWYRRTPGAILGAVLNLIIVLSLVGLFTPELACSSAAGARAGLPKQQQQQQQRKRRRLEHWHVIEPRQRLERLHPHASDATSMYHSHHKCAQDRTA